MIQKINHHGRPGKTGYYFLIVTTLLFQFPAFTQSVTITPQWMNVYGTADLLDGSPAAIGTLIQAYDPDNVLCGTWEVYSAGLFGYMAIYRDDPLTAVDEGMEEGDTIRFLVNSAESQTEDGDPVLWSMASDPLMVNLVRSGDESLVQASIRICAYQPDSLYTLSIEFSSLYDNQIFSADIQMTYNASVLQFLDASTEGTVASGWGNPVVNQTESGHLTMAMAGVQALQSTGPLVLMTFRVIGTLGDTCTVGWEQCILNEGTPPAFTRNCTIEVGQSSSADPEISMLPDHYTLGQNTPNPFNPYTLIHFSIPENAGLCPVKLEIFDIMSRRVKMLMNQKQKPGHYTVHWNGQNDQGMPMTSGVYFYRLQAGAFVQTRKMMFLK